VITLTAIYCVVAGLVALLDHRVSRGPCERCGGEMCRHADKLSARTIVSLGWPIILVLVLGALVVRAVRR
jgi:hypothetical protein